MSKSFASTVILGAARDNSSNIGVFTNSGSYIAFYSKNLIQLLRKLKSRVYYESSSWAILIKGERELESLRQTVKKLDIFIDSNFFVFDVSGCPSEVKTYALYKIGERIQEVHTEIGGLWTPTIGFQPPLLSDPVYNRRKDFFGYPIKGIGVKVFPHFTTYTDDGGVTGFVGDLVTILKHTHNFSLSFRVLEGYAYGKLIGDDREANQWTGMVGELQRKNVDLTVSELSITRERSDVVSYTQPLYIISRKMYVTSRIDTRQKLLTYTAPMEASLFISIFFMMVILVLFLTLISYLQHRYIPPNGPRDKITIPVAAWYMLSALLQQGSPECPTGISTRMVFWYGFMFGVVVYTSYSATLVSHLAVVLPVPLPFEDFYGLVKQTGWMAGNVRDDLFQVIASQTCAGDPKESCKILQNVWHTNIAIEEANLVTTYFEGLSRTKEENYVFIGVDVTTNNYIKQLPGESSCGINELPTKYIPGGIGIGVQHNSPFLPIFDDSLQKLREMGVMEKLVRKWLKVDTTCAPKQIVSADMIDVASVFTLLILGTFAALIIVAIETLFQRDVSSSGR